MSRTSLGLSDISGSEGLEDQEMPHTSRPSLLCTSTGLLDPDDLSISSQLLYPNNSLSLGHGFNSSPKHEDETDG